MRQRPSGTTLIVIILLSGIVFAGANLLVAGSNVFDGHDVEARFRELAAAAGEV